MPRHSDVWGVELDIKRLLTPMSAQLQGLANLSPVSTEEEAGWVREPAWTLWRRGGKQPPLLRGKTPRSPDNFTCSIPSNYGTRKAGNKLTE
jgi:hypothetical protein